MHPLARNVIIGAVALLIAGGFTALAVITRDSSLSVLAMLAAGMIAVAAGIFLFVQGWIWSQRAYRRGATGRSVLIAIGGGHGFKFASLIGRVLAELAVDGSTARDLQPFRFDRPILQLERPPKRYLV